MEPWRHAWRAGIVPQCSREALEALRAGLAADDPRLVQGRTTRPEPIFAVADWPCQGACPLGYLGYRGDDTKSVGEVEEEFARLVWGCVERLGREGAARPFIRWWDDTPRPEAVAALLAEVGLALSLQPEGVR